MKGITLVALVITIIVLLILATVSINLVINNGILEKAKTAVDKYSEGGIEEQIKLAHQEYQMSKFTDLTQQNEKDFLHLKLDQLYGAENIDIVGTDPLLITLTNGEKIYLFKLSLNGGAEQVYWTQNGKTVTNIKTGQILEVGDTVYYNSGVTSYEGTGDNQGKWAVLGAENGSILIMSKESIGSVSFNAKEGYFNGSALLENICTQYKNETFANISRSIKVEDINRITGYTPSTPTTYIYTMVDDKVKRNDATDPSSSTSFEHIDGRKLPESSPISVTHNYYSYFLNETSLGSKVYNFLILSGKKYVLDSKFEESSAGGTSWGFRVVHGNDKYVSGYLQWNSTGASRNNGYDVRAVVLLKTNIQFSGSSSTGWTLKLD